MFYRKIKGKMKKLLFLLLPLSFQSQTLKEVHSYLYQVGMKHPDIVMAQVIYESQHLKSYNATHRNNILGLGPHITFESWKQCVLFYKFNINIRYRTGDYFEFLKCMYTTNSGCKAYCPEDNYIQRIKEVYKNIEGC